MATKKAAAKTQAAPIKETAEEQDVYVAPKPVAKEPQKPQWEFKDRTYFLADGSQPLVWTIPVKHSRRRSLLWFDPNKGYQRELRYASNQKSPFVDEQEGTVTLEHVVFRNGSLTVPKEKVALQKLLSLYHPLKDNLYYEFDAVEVAEDELDIIELELNALNLANTLDIDELEAILRVEFGSRVNGMTSKEIKRDAMIYAKRQPKTFIDLAQDENVQLRNFGIKSVEQKFINLSSDQRHFIWSSTGRKLFTIPFDENPYSALAAWLKTDEGVEVYQNLQKRLK
jgi:hypothetical protein